MFSLSTVTPASGQVVLTTEAKEHLRLLHNEDDRYIDGLIAVATQLMETYTSMALLSRTLKITYDSFEEKLILPIAPVTSVTHLKYYDANGSQQTVNSADYQYDLNAVPVELCRTAALGSWPTLDPERVRAIEIQFVTGYASLAAIPENFKLAIKMLVADMYWKRTSEAEPNSVKMAELLVYPFKLWM